VIALGLLLAVASPDLPPLHLPGAGPATPSTRPVTIEADWTTLSPHLRVRPFSLEHTPEATARQLSSSVGRTAAPGLRFAVVLDTPETVGLVGPSAVEGWQRSEAEVYAVALAHTRATLRTDLERYSQKLPGLSGTSIDAELWSGGDTVAALADIRTFVGPAPHGVLISAPSRSMVVVHRLDPMDNLGDVLATFAALATVGAPAGHERFSDSLYWWHDDTFRVLTVTDPHPGPPAVDDGPTLDALRSQLARTPKR